MSRQANEKKLKKCVYYNKKSMPPFFAFFTNKARITSCIPLSLILSYVVLRKT